MQTSATNRRLRLLLTSLRDGTLIPNPHFQRRLVWSNAHKIAFLETVLGGYPFPEIFTAAGAVNPDTGDGTELIVDGQQRITTLNQYFINSGDLRLGTLPAYADLSAQKKMAFLEYEVVVRDLGAIKEAEVQEIFFRINSTKYSLNAMEVNNARFDGALKRFAEEVSERKFFQDNPIFTSLDGKRMNDVRTVLTIIISMLSGYFNRDEEHGPYLEKYNDEFTHQDSIDQRLEDVCTLITDAEFEPKSRIWQKADLLTAFIEIDRYLTLDGGRITAAELKERADAFYEDVRKVTHGGEFDTDAEEYYRRVRSGVNDRISREKRGDAWRARVLS